jgi:hypothetical protein
MIKRELPVASADHSRGVGEEDRVAAPGNGLVEIAREVPEDRGAFPISGSGEKWQQAPAVKVCGGSASGGVNISGVGIQVDDWHPAGVVGVDPARPAGEERPAEPAFMIAAFGPAQGRDVGGLGRFRFLLETGGSFRTGLPCVVCDVVGPDCRSARGALVRG